MQQLCHKNTKTDYITGCQLTHVQCRCATYQSIVTERLYNDVKHVQKSHLNKGLASFANHSIPQAEFRSTLITQITFLLETEVLLHIMMCWNAVWGASISPVLQYRCNIRSHFCLAAGSDIWTSSTFSKSRSICIHQPGRGSDIWAPSTFPESRSICIHQLDSSRT